MEVGCGLLNREARRWGFGVTLTLMLCLSMRVYIHGVSEDQYAFMGDLKNMILGISVGEISPQHHDVDAKKHAKNVVSPNLTTCHESVPRPGLSVYCCPPKPESEEPFIDFQFPDPSSPLRLRRAAHLVDDDYIAKYRNAVSIMKSLPYDDPRSFLSQANLHCIYCTGAYKQKNSDIPLHVHRSWLFFPWHRMMLYFHERILGSLIGDDSFALPFWNWDNPDGMVIPEMYVTGSLVDTDRENSHLPPQVVDLNYNLQEKGLGPEEQIKINMALMYTQMVSGAKTTELFMGCPYKGGEGGFCEGPGTIELAPHNTLHDWTGTGLNPGREDMGSFYSAGRDPIFYGHHGNVDRLWEVWRRLQWEYYNSEITDTEWLDSYFFFHDEKRQLVRIKFQDVVNITRLRYAYEEVELPWLNARPRPSVPPKIARDILKMRDLDHENNQELPSSPFLSADFGPHGRTLDTTIRVKVHRPKKHRSKKQKDFKEEEVMVVYGIEVKEDSYVKFDVYVNAVDETLMVGPEFREFAGTFVNIPIGVWPVMRRKSNLKLGISELLQDLEADEDESIWVTLIPRAEDCMNVTIDGIRIEYIE
ncbi:hypothetical protein VitviT2T_003338 [Vitis vinifera]|uniref:Tyrosinase copper-binding domain-containing protein n=2 Tax=Vitis vinifera TaxID=29760 RepID=A0ABY9BLX9_VITVI|nr:aureusidin synthase [Vitis vinifera]WJZ83677.1 hypothetical protein VitviT2T_003338 [Vitis vinifera]|eukprot:XP_010645091.1 PREDICTED: aureusidin synthase [Vitis vinifera]